MLSALLPTNLPLSAGDLTDGTKLERLLLNVFIVLTICDGILRRWVMPSLMYVIMPVKLGVLLLFLLLTLRHTRGITYYETIPMALALVTFTTTLLFGHGDLLVDIWGTLPYIFVYLGCHTLGRMLTRQGLDHLIDFLLYVQILHYAVTLAQFNLPASHWIHNVGGEEYGGVRWGGNWDGKTWEATGMIRPAGIFMMTTTVSPFASLVAGLAFYRLFLAPERRMPTWLLWAIFLSALSQGFVSVSRTCTYYVAMCMAFVLIMSKADMGRVFSKLVFIGVPLVTLLLNTTTGRRAYDNMAERFENGGKESDYQAALQGDYVAGNATDMYNRTFGLLVGAMFDPEGIIKRELPFWGLGKGINSITGIKLMGNDRRGRPQNVAEFESLQIITECGLLMGWATIFFRMLYFCRFIPLFPMMKRRRLNLAIALYPSMAINFFPTPIWGNLGFSCLTTLIGGMFMAAWHLGLRQWREDGGPAPSRQPNAWDQLGSSQRAGRHTATRARATEKGPAAGIIGKCDMDATGKR